jgi:DNA-binding transcriptional ArsR family regulator
MTVSTERLERLVEDGASGCGTTLAECEAQLSAAAAEATPPEGDVAALAALANETRYELVRLLHIAGEELCVCELTAVAEVSDSAVSHALRKLREAGLVTARKEGRWKYYQTTDRATALIIALEGTK